MSNPIPSWTKELAMLSEVNAQNKIQDDEFELLMSHMNPDGGHVTRKEIKTYFKRKLDSLLIQSEVLAKISFDQMDSVDTLAATAISSCLTATSLQGLSVLDAMDDLDNDDDLNNIPFFWDFDTDNNCVTEAQLKGWLQQVDTTK